MKPQHKQEPSLEEGDQVEINMNKYAMVMEEDLYEIP